MSNRDKHHYIPQFLLRRWSNKRGDVNVWTRVEYTKKLKAKPRKTQQFGYVRGLYAVTNAGPELSDLIEKKIFSNRIESRAAKILRLLTLSPAKLSPAERADWAAFLTSFHFRHPKFITSLRGRVLDVVRDATAQAREDDDVALKHVPVGQELDWINSLQPGYLENLHLVQLVNLISSTRLNYRLISMNWTVFDLSRADNSLLLGDRPFVSIKQPGLPPFVALPIGPKQLFVACDPQYVESVLPLSRRTLVRATNDETMRQAIQFVCGDATTQYVDDKFSRPSPE